MKCQYSLDGLPSDNGMVVCPECGSSNSIHVVKPRKKPPRWSIWLLAIFIASQLAAFISFLALLISFPFGLMCLIMLPLIFGAIAAGEADKALSPPEERTDAGVFQMKLICMFSCLIATPAILVGEFLWMISGIHIN